MMMLEKTGQMMYSVIGGIVICTEKIPLLLENGLKIQIKHYW